MKTLISIALALVATCAQADEWVIDSVGGASFTLHPQTLRVYTNIHKNPQADLLVSVRHADGSHLRHRIAVTGCAAGVGRTVIVDSDGNTLGQVREWFAGGERVYDIVATTICRAVRQRATTSSTV